MKYILIIGKMDAGKSTTINAVCEKLSPDNVYELKESKKFEEIDYPTEILNGTFLLKKEESIILVVAGAPTEQNITITKLFERCISFEVKVTFALVAKRQRERREGFHTISELNRQGVCVLEERIQPINREDFKNSKEWNDRISRIYNKIIENL